MQRNAALSLKRAPERAFARETTLLVGVAVALPFIIHLIPSESVPWGARLLPMFLAPLLGVMLYRLHVGLIPALLAPVLNAVLTGSPVPVLVGVLTFELVAFTVVAFLLFRRRPNLWIAAPLSYVAAKLGSTVAVASLPWLSSLRPAARFALGSIETAVPGLIILVAVTLLTLQLRPATPVR